MTEFTLTTNLQAHAAVVLCTKTSKTQKTQVTLQPMGVYSKIDRLSHFKHAVNKKKEIILFLFTVNNGFKGIIQQKN